MTGGPGPELQTARLLLRQWRDSDRDAFAALNGDSRVMEHFPSVLSRSESDAFIARIEAFFAEHGFGLWAVEVPGVAPFIGFVGLSRPRFDAHFMPCVEVGWRLAADHWGQGYAPEAAGAALTFGFESVGLAEIVSFTTISNLNSQRVMQKLGMHRDVDGDFDHPLTPGWPGRRHVLYRLGVEEWAADRRRREASDAGSATG